MLNDFACNCPVYVACGFVDLRKGIDGLAGIVGKPVSDGSVPAGAVSVLRAKEGSAEGIILGRRRVRNGLQEVRKRTFPVAQGYGGSKVVDASAIPLADGGAECGTAKGDENPVWSQHEITEKRV